MCHPCQTFQHCAGQSCHRGQAGRNIVMLEGRLWNVWLQFPGRWHRFLETGRAKCMVGQTHIPIGLGGRQGTGSLGRGFVHEIASTQLGAVKIKKKELMPLQGVD